MAANIDALIRISAKVQGRADLDGLANVFGNLQNSVGAATQSLQGFARERSWRDTMAAKTATVAGFAAGLFFATRAAVAFESSMSDVRKVVEGIETPRQFSELRGEILSLSKELPISAKGFADIYAAAGQSGIARNELKDFAELVGRVGVAFDISSEEAGVALSQLKVALRLTNDELELMADAMNHVSNVTGASAAQMVEFMSRAGSVGKLAGLTGQDTMAFGAAMIQAGTDTEVAATSFRNMINALSKGPSMTDRQVGALKRLGYAMIDSKDVESDLTRHIEQESRNRLSIYERQGNEIIREAEEQSERRLEIEQEETDGIIKEINRRYRAKMQALEDKWDDETSSYEDSLQDQTRAQIKFLERQRSAEIKAARKRAEEGKYDNEAEIQAIDDSYEERIEEIRDAQDRELTLRRRADRDKRQSIRDELQAQEDQEQDAARKRLDAFRDQEDKKLEAVKTGVKDRYDAARESEDIYLQKAKADAKQSGEDLANASTQGFADRLQQEGQRVIIEVLGRISRLPKSQQVSVISDLFGDEARGLPSLLSNLSELERILGEVGKQQEYAGSVTRESEIRFKTSAAQMQLFNNNVEALKIAFGEALLPVLIKVVQFMTPVVKGLTAATEAVSGLITRIAQMAGLKAVIAPLIGPLVVFGTTIAGIFSTVSLARWAGGLKILARIPGPLRLIGIALTGLGLAASPLGPIIMGISTALTVLQAIKWAGALMGGVGSAIAAFSGFLGFITTTFVPAIVAMFSGPVGWTVLLVGAVVAMAIAFREPILDFLTWFADSMARGFQSTLDTTRMPVFAFFEWFNQFTLISLQTIWALVDTLLVQPFIFAFENIIRAPIVTFGQWLGAQWEAFAKAFNTNFVKPLVHAYDVTLRQPVVNMLGWLSVKWQEASKAFDDYLVSPIQNAWQAVVSFIPNAMEAASRAVSDIWQSAVDGIRSIIGAALNPIIDTINRITATINNAKDAFNSLPGYDLPFSDIPEIPKFARGGFVTSRTLAEIGEGGEPEYVVPASKATSFAGNILNGVTGERAISGSTNKISSFRKSQSFAPSQSTLKPSILIQTGPVQRRNDGDYVTLSDLEMAVSSSVEQTLARVQKTARQPGFRRRTGSR
jgi:hypothetical protein